MKISVVVNCHENSLVFKDTLDSISTYLSKDILLICDGSKKNEFKDIKDVYKTEGLIHNGSKAPYKNVALGLFKAWQIWGKSSDWYCYMEPDCLVGINNISDDLNKTDAWILGNNIRLGRFSDKKIFTSGNFAFIEKIIGSNLNNDYYYLLGCCVFYKNVFIEKLVNLDFFNKFIFYTNALYGGTYPEYKGYDISEHLYPTLACNLGGKIHQFANFNDYMNPSGDLKYYLRYKPELGIKEFEFCKNAYVMHPIKQYDNLIRSYHRQKRLMKFIN